MMSKKVTLTEPAVKKGGQNPDNTSDARPAPPQGSGALCRLSTYPGMTVEEAIEQLMLLPAHAVLTIYGDYGYYFVGGFEQGFVYQTDRDRNWSFVNRQDELPKYCKKFDAVSIE